MAKVKKTSSTEQRIKSLVRQHGTPIAAISAEALLRQVKLFNKLLPRVHPYYAVKANPYPEIVRTFVKAGIGFDVASSGEIDLAMSCGATPDRLLFANTVKPSASIEYAKSKEVTTFTFDSEYELNKIARHAPGSRVLVRIKVPNVGSLVELSLKFGAEPADAIPLLIKAHKLGLKAAGVSFHVGSQCTEVGNFVDAIEMADIILRDARLKQLPLDTVDIGGGFPIRHFDEEQDYFGDMAATLRKELDRCFDQTVNIIAEPGRFMVGPTCTLVMRVIGKAIRENKHWYFLDDGVYGALSGMIQDHCKYQFKVFRKGETTISALAGPTCDSLDIITRGEDLPELDVGDVVYVENIGAYSTASSTAFNGIPPARVVFMP